jgi:hypothetical protein
MILHEVLPLFTGQEMVNDILRRRRKFHRPAARCIKVPTLDDQLEEYGKNFDPKILSKRKPCRGRALSTFVKTYAKHQAGD